MSTIELEPIIDAAQIVTLANELRLFDDVRVRDDDGWRELLDAFSLPAAAERSPSRDDGAAATG